MNAAIKHAPEIYQPPSMKGAFFTSALFHVLLFTLTAVGLPFVAKDQLIISPPINVEIIDIDEFTQSEKIKPPKKKTEKPPEPSPEQSNPAPPKMTSEQPPELTEPAPPEITEKIPEKPVKKPPPKPEKPKAKPKKETNDFASLLKNLTPDTNTGDEKKPELDPSKENTSELSQIAMLANKMSISEIDAIRQQIAPCWNVPAGAKYAEELIIEVRVLMNRDMTVQSASILNQGRYNRDSHFRAAADSALRALRNPRCSPLKLPAEKYDQWKVMTIRFDPRDIL